MRAKLITFSGLDGAGKSTQIDHLKLSFINSGGKIRIVWARGGYTPLMESVKNILRGISKNRALPPSGPNPRRSQAFKNPMVRKLWLILAILDLWFVYAVQIRWWRLRGINVICDRYVWDTLIDLQLNFPQENIERWLLWRWLVKTVPQPAAAFLLVIPVAESVRRSDRKGEPFRDPPAVLAQRLDAYLALAADWRTLDCTRPAEDVAAEIRQVLRITTSPIAPQIN